MDTYYRAKELYAEGNLPESHKLLTNFIVSQRGISGNAAAQLTDAFNTRGHIHYRWVDFDEAIQDYSEAIKVDPTFAVAYYNRGQVHYRLGRLKLAQVDLKQALFLQPSFPDAQLHLSQVEKDLNGHHEFNAQDPLHNHVASSEGGTPLPQYVAIKWWLGLDTSEGSQCALCPGSTLDHLGHHAVTCKYGEDVVSRHNRIRDILVETCRRAHIGVKVEVGNNLSRDHSKTRPADILLPNWFLGRTAALDVSITSPLNPVTLLEAGVSATAAAQATEARKHQANDPKCSELGWVCVPMVVETYGAWGKEATAIISSVASRLATSTCRPKSTILHEIYGRLNLNLVCANATAILSRIAPPP
ncbi:hypothetical protein EMCRGX_G015258 [Ephydatia muelleri]